MSKELIEDLLIEFDEMGFEPTTLCDSQREVDSFRNRLKQVLDYLKAIDNTKPSEALEVLLKAKQVCDVSCIEMCNNCQKHSAYCSIKQALIKAQEQEKENAELKKVLSIIKEKDVNIWYLTISTKVKNYKDYNSFLMNDKNKRKLTQEEFDLLKRYFK